MGKAEITRLQNSIAHLQRTQSELLHYLRGDDGEDEDDELGKAVKENEEVMCVLTFTNLPTLPR